MSRYIDADALIENFGKLTVELWLDSVEEAEIVSLIGNSPSIDIVRCRECKKANTEHCSHSYWDDDWGVWRIGYNGDEWFCADGERREP